MLLGSSNPETAPMIPGRHDNATCRPGKAPHRRERDESDQKLNSSAFTPATNASHSASVNA